ncbi:tRNA pseudouridine(38/39) synthase-like [Narcine bancroftii]|uniref:tRNA pseudouridine(38/39) synthase-like n=1 Tax=Narcine bancroftii TaxID=1343680 RepID=UPI003831DAA9
MDWCPQDGGAQGGGAPCLHGRGTQDGGALCCHSGGAQNGGALGDRPQGPHVGCPQGGRPHNEATLCSHGLDPHNKSNLYPHGGDPLGRGPCDRVNPCPHRGGLCDRVNQCLHGRVICDRANQCPHSGGTCDRVDFSHNGDPCDRANLCPCGGGPCDRTNQCPHGRCSCDRGNVCPHSGAPPDEIGSPLPPGPRAKQRQRPFDFSQHGRRLVAVRLAYLGWGYQGFASQENTSNTVEAKLFEALTTTRLVESRQTANYHRCGRTDKGVSAFGQVISLYLRSRTVGLDGSPLPGAVQELPYTHLLNRVLPRDIRALAWAPAPPGFSARFSCLHRTYRYLFPSAGLDLERMGQAATLMQGSHDFRNLCRMDVANGVVNFWRTVLSARLRPQGPGLCCLEVRARAFLYHQVRCMAAVLLLVGRGLEEPKVVSRLLDVDSNPCKPQYSMAVDYPLILYDCAYENLEWIFDPEVHAFNLAHLQEQWACQAIKTRILYSMLTGMGHPPTPLAPEEEAAEEEEQCALTVWGRSQEPVANLPAALQEGVHPKRYKRLMERQTCEALEARIQHYAKRGRLRLPKDMRGAEGTGLEGEVGMGSKGAATGQDERKGAEKSREGQQDPAEPLEGDGQGDSAEALEEMEDQQDPAES